MQLNKRPYICNTIALSHIQCTTSNQIHICDRNYSLLFYSSIAVPLIIPADTGITLLLSREIQSYPVFLYLPLKLYRLIKMSLKYKTKYFDFLGVSAALLCLVHCLVFPLLIFIPLGISHNPYIDLLFLSLGIWSVYKTGKASRSASVKYLLWTGILLISISIGMDIFLHQHSPLMYAGAMALVAGHLINLKTHHKPNAAAEQTEEKVPYEQKY